MINPVLNSIVKQLRDKLPDLRIRLVSNVNDVANFDYGSIVEKDGRIVVVFSGYCHSGTKFNLSDEDIIDQLIKFMTPVAESNRKVLKGIKSPFEMIPYQNPISVIDRP